jgi:type II secretory ATPase GspE/PulE/Tfp pilus assembly ATPase PilB-like protein
MEKEIEKFKSDSEKVAEELAKTLGLPYFNLQFVKPDVDALKYISKNLAEQAKVIPIQKKGNILILGVVNPYHESLEEIKKYLAQQGFEIKIGIISPDSFEEGLKEYRYVKEKISYIGGFDVNPEIIMTVQEKIHKKEDVESFFNEVIKKDPFLILDYLLAAAIKFNTSDIHFEPYEDRVVIRYRIDGILYDIFSFSKKIYSLLKNRIKILSGMMINVKDKPQDGRFSITIKNQNLPEGKENIDFRVSVVPAGDDEAIVLRILIFSSIANKKLEDLGLRQDDLKILKEMIHLPNGLILNTGPTGSGKTTTLYTILMAIKKPELKILTVENPIEYKIEGISQTQIDEARGFTFAAALRAFLRHDPDVILVGEIRDKETAQIAIQASLTGHLVLSTLHTNDSLGAIPRLISLEVDPKLIPPALRLVIAQRLVRKICPNCFLEYKPDEELKRRIQEKLKNLPSRVDLSDINLQEFTLLKAQGCSQCFGTGYKGRIAIVEFLRINKKLEALIHKNPSDLEILEAVKDDFVSLQQDALIKALRKITTIEEVERVTGLI